MGRVASTIVRRSGGGVRVPEDRDAAAPASASFLLSPYSPSCLEGGCSRKLAAVRRELQTSQKERKKVAIIVHLHHVLAGQACNSFTSRKTQVVGPTQEGYGPPGPLAVG